MTIPRALPRIGLAVSDASANWCAEFSSDPASPPLSTGARLTIVLVHPASEPPLAARIVGPQQEPCPAAFPQPRWIDYQAYRLELADPTVRTPAGGSVALVVAGDVRWEREPNRLPRADLDGDGVPEEARRCAADEGEHFTIWSVPRSGPPARRWHEYYDWGALVDRTCKPGEDGRGPAGNRPR